ncbi:dTDP-4-dehydrorhamnose 3,5-epimerase [Paenibacillus sp. JJ-100]|uniref:dTDP-4-dehydrorhamnose 3,5-epimerase n=1 Tax=Paenibacillus sp. JJ-100 TaxID=2974896 RepID=UPI0023314645|nr:dTDP-4-dehydrorhamnose 3,5-epimerase [Paenibacillus sp. JJ-100]
MNQAKLIKIEPIEDHRGYFARSFCENELNAHGIDFSVKQANIAFNKSAGTLRGMHFQLPPYAEDKIVTCTSGALYDVIIDLNRESSTFGQWYGVNLTSENCLSLYVPKGFAHGYLTLLNDTSIHYMVTEKYTPTHESGVRWDDPAFSIDWPETVSKIISDKDNKWTNFSLETDGV